MIHFTNGSIVAASLVAAGVPGRVVECADPLHEGPCVAGLSAARWRETRARFLARNGDLAFDAILADLAERDAAIAEAAGADEIVLWFEHDLFDQLNLLWLLEALAAARAPRGRVRTIVVGEHAEVPRFHGLGQLTPPQLLALFPRREPLTGESAAEAHAAWADVCAPDPRGLARRAASPSTHWVWLPGALQRLVEELPDVVSGLSRTERQGLEGIAAGARTLGEAFQSCAAREERVFLGDWSFFGTMRGLARAPAPLVRLGDGSGDDPSAAASAPIALTGVGRRVLAGEADHVAINGIDRWVGGVHLAGASSRWRWDPAGHRVTPSA